MKKLIIATAAAIGFTAAVEATAEEPTKFEMCGVYHEFASAAMRAHQAGVPMPNVLRNVEHDPVLVEVVREAYSYPRYNTERYQEEAELEFSDSVYAECLKAYD